MFTKSIRSAALLLCFAGNSPLRTDDDNREALSPRETPRSSIMDQNDGTANQADGVANLPYAFGNSFRTLDEYLSHLRQYAGPIDLPWWREVRPGVFEEQIHMTGARPETATRAELERRYGFSR